MNVLILWHRKIIVSLVLAISFFDMFTIQAFAATPSTVVPAKTETTPFHYAGTDTSISSNPAAVNVVTGTGTLQRFVEEKLGIQNDHGIYVGGAWIADANQLFSGGISDPDRLTFNSLLLLDISVDTEKMAGWNGGLFGVEFLQLNAQNTNMQAGSIQEYNSIPGSPPLNRFEVYQLWYRQELFNKKLIVRLGKSVPTFDFGNVVKPVSLNQSNLSVPAATSLLYTPIFINPAMIGVMPGYYNSAFGVTISFIPGKTWYFSYGIYDGNLASGKQTGLTGPNFNGAYFQIAETGSAWLLGTNSLPGNIGIGAWHQDGLIQQSTPNLTENSASGFYLFGTQRLWYKNPGENNSGIATFYQYGTTNSNVLPMQKYIGTGLTGFGLVPHRPDDSMGIGAAFSWLNQHSFTRSTELMFQAYYQAKIINGIYLEPALSYIPTPGASANLPAAWAGTIRTIVLF